MHSPSLLAPRPLSLSLRRASWCFRNRYERPLNTSDRSTEQSAPPACPSPPKNQTPRAPFIFSSPLTFVRPTTTLFAIRFIDSREYRGMTNNSHDGYDATVARHRRSSGKIKKETTRRREEKLPSCNFFRNITTFSLVVKLIDERWRAFVVARFQVVEKRGGK